MSRCLIDLQTTLSLNLDNCILIAPDEVSGNFANLIAELGNKPVWSARKYRKTTHY
jgi:hypothetical protein